jgi:hypothetical protein
MSAMIEWPTADGLVAAGARVRDRKRPVDAGTVLTVRNTPAAAYYVESIETTVAADNPAYPASDRVIDVVWTDLDTTDLAAARDEPPVYHFPASRLVGESCMREVPPSDLRVSPYHHRTFLGRENRGYIRAIHAQGYIESVLVARETPAGLELVAGHKRRWVAQKAHLDTIAVRVVDLSEWEAAIHYAQDHLPSLDEEPARQTVQSLVDRWGDQVADIPAVSEHRLRHAHFPCSSAACPERIDS